MGLFDSVNKKLWRAHQHAEALNLSIETWQNDGFEVRTHRDPEGCTFVVGVEFSRPAPLQEWALLLGDAVHNWRSALDHAVYAMAIHDSGTNPPPGDDKIMFPVAESEADFLGQAGRRLAALSQESIDAVESVQPYNRPNSQPGLRRLAALDNEDKHRSIRVVAVAPRNADLRFSEDVTGRGTLRLHALDTTKPDWIVAVELDEPKPKGIEINLGIRIMVKLLDEPAPQPTVSELLSHFNSEVWTVKAVLERAIDPTYSVDAGSVNGMWPPEDERWIGQTRRILHGESRTADEGEEG